MTKKGLNEVKKLFGRSTRVVDTLIALLVQSIARVFQVLPEKLGIRVISYGLRFFTLIQPKHKKIALQNLSLAFPEKDEAWRHNILERSYDELAKLIVVSLRLPSYPRSWIDEHVAFARAAEWDAVNKSSSETGILIATGHLGCFELMAHAAALFGYPMSFIVRNFKAPKLDAWWKNIRESSGNTVIDRKGAYKKTVRTLQRGRNVGILFDQNVTRNRAVFVDFFGVPAATSKAFALAALQVQPKILVVTMRNLPGGKYQAVWKECEVEDIYASSLPRDEKVYELTRRASEIFEGMVRDYPEGWFWMHRRWKTRPSEEDVAIY